MTNAIFNTPELGLAGPIAELITISPFSQRANALQREILADEWRPAPIPGEVDHSFEDDPNWTKIRALCETLSRLARQRLRQVTKLESQDRRIFASVAIGALWGRYQRLVSRLSLPHGHSEPLFDDTVRKPFESDLRELLGFDDALVEETDLDGWLAFFDQRRRAMHQVLGAISGSSAPANEMRDGLWNAVMTHDQENYMTTLRGALHAFPVLLSGATGSDKERVATSIARSSYVPLDSDPNEDIRPSLFSFALGESSTEHAEFELFGHGSGFVDPNRPARAGQLEDRREWDTLFLADIDRAPQTLQLKLLRLLRTQSFRRIGDNRLRKWRGRFVAATTEPLSTVCRDGRLSTELLYCLCAASVRIPSLAMRIGGDVAQLRLIVAASLRRPLNRKAKPDLVDEITESIVSKLGVDHPWPGDETELAQRLSSALLKGPQAASGQLETFVTGPRTRSSLPPEITVNELFSRYWNLVTSHGSDYQQIATPLRGDESETVTQVDQQLISRLRESTRR